MSRKLIDTGDTIMYGHQKDFMWPVVPLCERQLRDVNPADVLNDGLYRRCDIYKGGGGYDHFEAIYHRRFGGSEKLNEQFVVQMQGCPFRCPYCYVTPDGILGEAIRVSTVQMVSAFKDTGFPVFHLMGGAPALYLEHWPELLKALGGSAVFHSDFLLLDGIYPTELCQEIAKYPKQLHAVSIKGWSQEEFKANTGVAFDEGLFWHNLDVLVLTGVPFYFTFTGMSEESIAKAKAVFVAKYGEDIIADSFGINIVHYNALD